jgi:hypothetical protein
LVLATDAAFGEQEEFNAAVQDGMRGVRDQMMGKVLGRPLRYRLR